LREVHNRIADYLAKLAPGGLCVAFSGGVDSALLLRLACDTGGAVHAVTVCTPFHSPLEQAEARELAEAFGAVHKLLMPDLPGELLDNPVHRCYLCKKALFRAIREYADGQGLEHLVDGTNRDDLGEYRPGLKALNELGVHSPLAELGITKAEVRELAAGLGLDVADKPSVPCLATRYPYDHPIRLERLPGIDRVERQARAMGISNVRARVEGETLRLEVAAADMPRVLSGREELAGLALEAGFVGISLDLEELRSGSMDIREARLAGRAGTEAKDGAYPHPESI